MRTGRQSDKSISRGEINGHGHCGAIWERLKGGRGVWRPLALPLAFRGPSLSLVAAFAHVRPESPPPSCCFAFAASPRHMQKAACCEGKYGCRAGDLWCNAKTGGLNPTAYHHHKGRGDEHWCVRIGQKKKNSAKKDKGKWIFSCSHNHGGRWKTEAEADKGIRSFRELLEFGETENVKTLRGSEVRWSDQAEARRVEMQLRLKREEGMSQRDRRQLKFELERDRAVLNPPAVAKRCPDAATGPPFSKRVAKKAPCAGCQTNGCIHWMACSNHEAPEKVSR